MRRIVITGLGIVSPTGIGVENAWKGCIGGISAVRQIQHFSTLGLPVTIAAEVDAFDASPLLGTKLVRQTSRFVQFACVAADEALKDAGCLGASELPRCGCIIGSAIGALGEIEESACALKEFGASKVMPHTLPFALPSMAAGYVAMRHRLMGPNLAVATACASGTHSIGEAAMHIRRGDADMMLAGGSEAATCPLSIASFARMRALSRCNAEPHRASRPFDANRDGFVMGEGCGLLVLEEFEHAQQRGAKVYAELVGYGASADAFHFTKPEPEGAGFAACIQAALTDGRLDASQVDYINAHGTSTRANDECESKAICKVFGHRANKLSISSTKGATGHCLGAAGGIEAVFTVLAIKEGIVPPTANYESPDPACPLDYTPRTLRQKRIDFAISNSAGFGGQNACLAFGAIR